MNRDNLYVRKLEDNSGYIVCPKPDFPYNPDLGGQDRWEEVLGLGATEEEAWTDYEKRQEVLNG